MCGICGIADFAEHNIPEETIERMVHSIRHRGPDDAGVYACGPVGMGHARLSIIDLSQTGHQPMSSQDGNYVLVYNGELYNHPDLRQRLKSKGYRFVEARGDRHLPPHILTHHPAALFALLCPVAAHQPHTSRGTPLRNTRVSSP